MEEDPAREGECRGSLEGCLISGDTEFDTNGGAEWLVWLFSSRFLYGARRNQHAKLSHSYAQSAAGEGRPMNEVFDELERSLK